MANPFEVDKDSANEPAQIRGRKKAQKGTSQPEAMRRLADTHSRVESLALRKEPAITETIEAKHFSQLIYSNRTDPYLAFLTGARRYHDAITTYQPQAGTTQLPSAVVYPDIFKLPIHGITLADIENLDYPLKKEGIATINRLIHSDWMCHFEGRSALHEQVVAQTQLLPAQVYTRADLPGRNNDRPFPKELQPLADRLTGYLDFYLPFIMDESTNITNEVKAFMSMAWVGTPLIRMLGMYIPARMGISPSSAIKEAQKNFTGPQNNTERFLLNYAEGGFLKYFKIEAVDALRSDVVPTELHSYLKYDPEQDKEASDRLQHAYQSKIAEYPRDLDPISEEFNHRRTDFKKSITAEKNQLKFKADLGTLSVDVVATAQYGKTIAFILQFRDRPVHLTLDLTDTNRLFGLPASVAANQPIIQPHLMRDLVKAATEVARQKYPTKVSLLELPPSPESLIPHPGRPITEQRIIEFTEPDEDSDQKTTRFQALRSLVAQFNPHQPPVPDQPTTSEIVNPVNCSPEMIRLKAGPKVPDRKIRQLIADIKLFERGGKRRRKLTKTDKVTEDDLVRIHSGDFRIVLKPNGSSYDIDEIADKKDVSYHK